MISPALEILNQKGTPMFNSDLFANRPTAGIEGRIFISIDTHEFYRDTGTSWELIGGAGSGTIDGIGTAGYLPIFWDSNTISDSSVYEDPNEVITSKSVRANSIYLTNMTAGNGALYYGVAANRLTLANYNAGGNVVIEVNGGGAAQFISGADLSTRFYGNIIRDGGTASQFLKADGSLDSTAYQPLLTNPVTGTGTATQVAFWGSSSSISGSNNLFWDSTNNRLGINTNIPGTALDVHGTNVIVQLNGTGTSNSRVSFQNAGNGKWQLGNIYSSGSNYFSIYDVVNSIDRVSLQNTGSMLLTGYFMNDRTSTAVFNDGWYGVYSQNTITIPANTSFQNVGNVFGSLYGRQLMTFEGNATFGNANVPASMLGNNIFAFSSAGSTITVNQGSGGTRAMSSVTAFNWINSANTGSVSNLAGFQVLAPYKGGTANLSVTSYYGLLINASDERTAFTITNKWGIYQEGINDRNYFNGNILVKTNTDNGNALQVSGNANFTGNLTVSGTLSATISGYLPLSGGTLTGALSGTSASFSSSVTAGAKSTIYDVSSNYQLSLGYSSSFYYDLGRSAVDGYFDFYGNQSGAIGYRFGGADGTRLTINASGNIGIGVIPSAWFSAYKAVQVGATASVYGLSGQAYFGNNVYVNSSDANAYITSNSATLYRQASGQHIWYNAPSGTAGNTISFTQAMTLDASGRLGIGTPSPSYKLHVQGTSYFFDQSIFGDKVGIGTLSPSEKLEVNGNIKTAAPSGNTAGAWKLGGTPVSIGGSDATAIPVEIDGSIYYLMCAYPA